MWTDSVNGKSKNTGSSRTSANAKANSTKTTGATNSKNTTEGGSNCKKRKSGKWCPLHNVDSHDMSECKVLAEQVKKMHASYASASSGN